MQNKVLRIISTVLLGIAIGCTLTFIIGNSALTPGESTSQSSTIYLTLKPIIEFFIGSGNFTELVFRKVTHFCEYFILGLEVAMLFAVIRYFKIKFLVLVLFIGLVVAVTDESVQILSGRGPEVLDILIDFGGYVLAFLIVVLVRFLHFFKSINWDKPKTANA